MSTGQPRRKSPSPIPKVGFSHTSIQRKSHAHAAPKDSTPFSHRRPSFIIWRGVHSPRGVVFFGQGLKAGNDVEQLLVNSALAQLVEVPIEIFKQFVDVFFGTLHRCQAAGVFTGQRLGACPEERDEEIFVDERP